MPRVGRLGDTQSYPAVKGLRRRAQRRRRLRSPHWGVGLAAGIVLVLLCGLVIGGCMGYAQTSSVTFTVEDKESVTTQDGHEYRVYTTQGTFKVADSWVHPRFNSSEVYGRLKDGRSYRCEVYGWRVPVLSQFKNILSCDTAKGQNGDSDER